MSPWLTSTLPPYGRETARTIGSRRKITGRYRLVAAIVASALWWGSAACGPPSEEAAVSPNGSDPIRPIRLLGVGDDAGSTSLLRLPEVLLGDFDAMVDRGVVRVLTTFSMGFYFLDGARQRGATFELVEAFERALRDRVPPGRAAPEVLILPVRREDLLPALVAGYGDLVAANLTATETRREQVDFSDPLLRVDEIVATGPTAPPLHSLEDLAGRELTVRRSSSYYESLLVLNDELAQRGRSPLRLREADPHLEDEDLLEMIGAGHLPFGVADSVKVLFWAQVHDGLTPRPDLVLREGGQIAWAMRKGSPQLREVVNTFVASHRRGTLFGNVVLRRYLREADWVQNAASSVDRRRFEQTVPIFRRYADRYRFDWRMIAALAYQESRLDPSARSGAGAVGVMQLLPRTAADPHVAIEDIESIESNIHAGTKYLRSIRDRYFSEPDLDEPDATLLAIAAYNAGPTRISRLRKTAAERGLDPNRWFGHVELVVARHVGREPVQYVRNIYKYYVTFRARHARGAPAEAMLEE